MFGEAPDNKLVARALAGSNSAWNKLIKRYERTPTGGKVYTETDRTPKLEVSDTNEN